MILYKAMKRKFLYVYVYICPCLKFEKFFFSHSICCLLCINTFIVIKSFSFAANIQEMLFKSGCLDVVGLDRMYITVQDAVLHASSQRQVCNTMRLGTSTCTIYTMGLFSYTICDPLLQGNMCYFSQVFSCMSKKILSALVHCEYGRAIVNTQTSVRFIFTAKVYIYIRKTIEK